MVPDVSRAVPSSGAGRLIVSLGNTVSSTGLAASAPLRYRRFTIGSSVDVVRAAVGPLARQVEVRFDRPFTLHRLTWRPAFPAAARDQANDSTREIVFDFVGNQLYRMTVSYDERKTEGLTHADVLASLEDTFGPSSVRNGTGRGGVSVVGDAMILAQWRTGDDEGSLRHFDGSNSYQLRLSSMALESAARVAETRAIALEARQTPGRGGRPTQATSRRRSSRKAGGT